MRKVDIEKKYDIREILYGLNEVSKGLKYEPELKYEYDAVRKAKNLLKKWVKKPVIDDHCPNCGAFVDSLYCPDCSQALLRQTKFLLKEYAHSTAIQNAYAKQKYEIEEYIRLFGVVWVLDTLKKAEPNVNFDPYNEFVAEKRKLIEKKQMYKKKSRNKS